MLSTMFALLNHIHALLEGDYLVSYANLFYALI